MTKYVIFCDGSCHPNPNGFGGWGALIIHETTNQRSRIKGGEGNTTNNRMELLAAIMALKHLPNETICTVTVISDSQYMRKGITQWIHNWKQNGWQTKPWKGRPAAPVKNADLWQQLDEIREKHEVKFKWVKGHSNSSGNCQADELANQGRMEFLKQHREKQYA